MNSCGFPLITLLLVSLPLIACRSGGLSLNATQRLTAATLKKISPEKDSLPGRTPVIDIHTHTFNARYLPLRAILHGKRDVRPPFSWLVTDRCAETIARALVDRTELAEAAGEKGIARLTGTSQLRASPGTGLVCRVFLGLLDKAEKAGCWDARMGAKEQMRRLDQVAMSMNPLEKAAVKTAVHMMGMEEHLETAKPSSGILAAVRFLWLTTQSDAAMTKLYRQLHAGPATKGPITMVSHGMDLGPVYDQQASSGFLDYVTSQLPRARFFREQSGSDLINFVAYNPYRDHWRGGRTGDALSIIKEAIRKGGATGVKVYPPSGYRAFGNVIKSRPVTALTGYPGKQWDARYGSDRDAAAARLNTQLGQLLDWCITHDIPVFTHAGHGEFEARKGYGIWNAHPTWWRRFLESRSTPGHPCRLRLCLGHAGGDDFWFGGAHFAQWGQEVYELCTEYPNVYCEPTTGTEMLDPERQAFFVDHLARLFEESKAKSAYPFSRKVLYGTDWYLPDAGAPADVLRETQRAFLHPLLKEHYRGYFSANAQAYLKLPRE